MFRNQAFNSFFQNPLYGWKTDARRVFVLKIGLKIYKRLFFEYLGMENKIKSRMTAKITAIKAKPEAKGFLRSNKSFKLIFFAEN